MVERKLPREPDARHRGSQAEEVLLKALQDAGWRIRGRPHRPGHRSDLIILRRGVSYAVEIKAGGEGRSDRLIPLWSQAFLQAAHRAGDHSPLAVVAAPRIAPRVARHILDFAGEYAPDAAAGVIDLSGLRLFRGPQLEDLNAPGRSEPPHKRFWPGRQAHLFSDLNQWMLKVLLAPELPQELLSAPRGAYRNASQLAEAAGVSAMSAYRFVQQLRRQGYLHESADHLMLVRREDLFKRWQVSALRRAAEAPMRFLLRGRDLTAELRQMVGGGRACLALFAAADALGFGLVEGVPPCMYVRRLPADLSAWKNLDAAGAGDAPDIIVRQAPAPRSVFRGAVRSRDLVSCDILQVWLDVAGHPSRGQEQADFIRRRVLGSVIDGDRHG